MERVEASRANLSIERLAGFWHAQGAIVEGGLAHPADYAPSVFARLRLPVVYCDDGESEFRGHRTSVRHDSRETTITATRALLDLHLPHYDVPIIKALEFIRLNACNGLRVDDIVATIGLSRRSFEMRFEKLVGRSVQDEIESVRFRTASDLLTRTRATIDAIAQQCGYAGASSLLHLFRKIAHTNPAEWRQRHGSSVLTS